MQATATRAIALWVLVVAALEQVADLELRRAARREAVDDQPAARPEELERGAAQLAADAVERDGDLTPVERRAHRVRPAGRAVVDGQIRAQLAHARHLLR